MLGGPKHGFPPKWCRVQPSSQAHTVRNTLIDQRMERAALVASEQDALELIRNPNFGQARSRGQPALLASAWSKDGAKAYRRCVPAHLDTCNL